MTQPASVSRASVGSVAVFQFARPERRNAINAALLAELTDFVDEVEAEESVRSVVFTGDEVAFSAGADLKDPRPPYFLEAFNATLIRIENLPKPTFAAISGWCLAGALELAMTCDFRIATRAARIGDWHVNVDSIGGAGAIPRLIRLVGLSHAKELVYTGDVVSGEEAWRIGLINWVADEGKHLDLALEIAGRLGERNSLTLGYAKKALASAADAPLYQGVHLSLELQRELRRRLGIVGPGRARKTDVEGGE